MLDHIFGTGPGFADRLGRIVRDELGLVYSIGGGITDSADLLPGLFRVYAGTMPDEADRVVAAITEQVRAMHDGAFSDDEVDRARRYLAGAYVFDFQTVEQRAERLLELERLGLALDEPMHWPERIAGSPPARSARPRRPTSAPRPSSASNTAPWSAAATSCGSIVRDRGPSDGAATIRRHARLKVQAEVTALRKRRIPCPAHSRGSIHTLRARGTGRISIRD